MLDQSLFWFIIISNFIFFFSAGYGLLVVAQFLDYLFVFNTKTGIYYVLTVFGQVIVNMMVNEIFSNIIPIEMVDFQMNIDEKKVIFLHANFTPPTFTVVTSPLDQHKEIKFEL